MLCVSCPSPLPNGKTCTVFHFNFFFWSCTVHNFGLEPYLVPLVEDVEEPPLGYDGRHPDLLDVRGEDRPPVGADQRGGARAAPPGGAAAAGGRDGHPAGGEQARREVVQDERLGPLRLAGGQEFAGGRKKKSCSPQT